MMTQKSKYHSDLLEKEIKQVESTLAKLKIYNIIAQADKEPDFLGICGAT